MSKGEHLHISYHFFLLITNTHTKVFLHLFLKHVEILGRDPMYMQHIQQAAETLEEFLIQTVSYKQYWQLIFLLYYNCTYIFAFSNTKGMGIKFITVTLFKVIYSQETSWNQSQQVTGWLQGEVTKNLANSIWHYQTWILHLVWTSEALPCGLYN